LKNWLLVIVCACVLPVGADSWLEGTTDKPPLDYKRGEAMVFTLTLRGGDAQASAVPMVATRTEADSPDPEVRLYALSVTCAGAHPATGYLSIPKKTRSLKRRILAVWHGGW